MRDYELLRGQGWPWRVAGYIAWASSPKIGRWPATLGELATKVLGLKSPRVIYTWRQKYASIETVVSMMQARPLWEHRADVYEALVRMATTANYKSHNDRKLFLEMIGDYVPRSIQAPGKGGADGGIEALSDDELRRWMGEKIRHEEPAKTVDDGRPADDAGLTIDDETGTEGEDGSG
jgi:hypothetical protein